MPNVFEEVKAAVVGDAALSQGDTSQCRPVSESGPQAWSRPQGVTPSSSLRPSLPSRWSPLRGHPWSPPKPALPAPSRTSAPLTAHPVQAPLLSSASFTQNTLTWASCFLLSLCTAKSYLSSTVTLSPPATLPILPLNTCALVVWNEQKNALPLHLALELLHA